MIAPNTCRVVRVGRRFRAVYRFGRGVERVLSFTDRGTADAFKASFYERLAAWEARWAAARERREVWG